MNFKDIFTEISNTAIEIIKKYRSRISDVEVRIKDDSTLLTAADEEVQDSIIKIINRYDPSPSIVAEEDGLLFNPSKQFTWVIDPIDGTAQFVKYECREFCTCVSVLERGRPIASIIILHEIGPDRTPVVATAFVDDGIYVNGQLYQPFKVESMLFSATRSKGVEPHPLESKLIELGYTLKNRTTSQSIDILRTVVDLSKFSDLPLTKFDGFLRRNQHLWDGIPGVTFCLLGELNVLGSRKKPLLPYSNRQLGDSNPRNDEIYILPTKLVNLLFKR